MRKRELVVLAVGLTLGMAIAYVDSRPTWDDTGITAAFVLGTSALLASVAPRRPWLIGLAVGGWIPVLGIIAASTYGSLLALVFALAGAYGGMVVRRMVAAH